MIDEKLVDNIRAHGVYQDSGEGRRRVLEDIGFRIGQRAEYIIITGCVQPEGMPHVLRALRDLLDHFRIDYTLLSKEYCCANLSTGMLSFSNSCHLRFLDFTTIIYAPFFWVTKNA